MARQALGAVAEQLQPNLALDAMRAGDRGKRDPALAAVVRSGQVTRPSLRSFGLSLRFGACGESSVGGAASSAPSAGASADSPSVGRVGWLGRRFFGGASTAASSAGASAASASSAASFLGRSFGSCLGRRLPRPPGPPRRLPRRPPRPRRSARPSRPRPLRRRRLRPRPAVLGDGSSCGAAAASAASAALAARCFDALLGLFARLGLLRVVARRALLDAGGIEEAQDAVRRLGADAQPVRDAVGVELHALGQILRQQRIVGADLLDEAAVTRVAAVGHDDAVIGALLGAAARQTNCNCHFQLPFVYSVYFFENLSKPGGRLNG